MITAAWCLRGGPCIWYAVGRGIRRGGSGICARLRAGVHIWPAIEQRECAGGEPQKALHEGVSCGAATQALKARALAEPGQELVAGFLGTAGEVDWHFLWGKTRSCYHMTRGVVA